MKAGMPESKCRIEVSQSALGHNFALLRQLANSGPDASSSPASLLAVIKANAYGHGASLCAPVLIRAGAAWLGVGDAAEGACVRQSLAGHSSSSATTPQLLVMCGMEAADAPLFREHRLTPVVWFPEQLRWLAAYATASDPLPVHLEIDTGMARQGVRPGPPLDHLLNVLAATPRLRLDGVLTHFASSEIAGSPHTALQQVRFNEALSQIDQRPLRPLWLHAGNTSTLDEAALLPWLHGLASARGMQLLARTGLALYGYSLPLQGGWSSLSGQLRPVATWKTNLIAVQELAAGDTVGYNATFTAIGPMRLGLLAAGYADGFRRELSSSDHTPGGQVSIGGQIAPVVGRVSMNLTSVDLSAIPHATLGEDATLLGPSFSAEQHARLAGTIPYEILCGMRGRIILVP